MVNENFCSDKKSGAFWTLFGAKLGHFHSKISFSDIFLRNRTSDLSKAWSETEENCFESSNSSVVSGKILVLPVLAIFRSKIHCMWRHLYGFGLFLVIFFQTVDVFI